MTKITHVIAFHPQWLFDSSWKGYNAMMCGPSYGVKTRMFKVKIPFLVMAEYNAKLAEQFRTPYILGS